MTVVASNPAELLDALQNTAREEQVRLFSQWATERSGITDQGSGISSQRSAVSRQPTADLGRRQPTGGADSRLVNADGSIAHRLLDELIAYTNALLATDAAKALEATQIAVNLAECLGTPLHQARARRALARALSYFGRFQESLEVCREGIHLAERLGSGADGAIEAGRLRLASMHALGEMGRLHEAIAHGEAARATFLAAGDAALAARADINLGIAYHKSDDPHLAVTCLERAAPALANEPLTLGILQNSRGEALLALNDFRGARAAFFAAIEAARTAGADLNAAIFEGNLADLACRQGRLQEALRWYEVARRRLESRAGGGAPGHLARIRAEQAEAMSILGLPAEALREYEAALGELEQCGLKQEAARARAGLGAVLYRLEAPEQAEDMLAAAAQEFHALGHQTARARVDLLRAELILNEHKHEGVEPRRHDAVSAGDPRWRANNQSPTTHDRALIDARTLALSAFEALRDRPADAAAARCLLGRIELALGNRTEAAAHLNDALRAAMEFDLGPLAAEALQARGELHRIEGRLPDAAQDFRHAVERVERLRGSMQAHGFRAAFLGERTRVYERLIVTLLDSEGSQQAVVSGQRSAVSEAFAVAEQARSRSLLERIALGTQDQGEGAGDESQEADGASKPLVAAAAEVRADLNALYSRQYDMLNVEQSAAAARRMHEWRQRVREREAELAAIETRLASTRGIGRLYAPTVSLDQAMRQLPPGTALVEYFFAGDELLAFVLRDGQAWTFRGLAKVAEISAAIRRVQFQMNRALALSAAAGGGAARIERLIVDAQRELQTLAALIIRPLRQAIEGASRLVIVPHGPLHQVPFAALWDSGRYLIEEFVLHLSPSASLLAGQSGLSTVGCRLLECTTEHAERAELDIELSSFRVFREFRGELGNPKAESREPRAPFSPVTAAEKLSHALVMAVPDEAAPRILDEARLVGSRLGGGPHTSLLVSDEATSAAFLAEAPRASLIHLAAHGRYTPEVPLGSGLRLSDRWITVRDIYELHLHADLVALSGCETGLGRGGGGDELLGVMQAFLAAGARNVLASLWPVSDEHTLEIMSKFYTSIAGAVGSRPSAVAAGSVLLNPAVHLGDVQRAALASSGPIRHPAFWAPFFMVGRTC